MVYREEPRRTHYWLILAWIAFVAVAIVWGLNQERTTLEARVAEALEGTDLDFGTVVIEGRDAVIKATGDIDDIVAAKEIIAAVEGVRDVRVVASTEAPDGQAPDRIAAQPVGSSTPTTASTGGSTTTTSPASQTTTTTAPVAAKTSTIVAELRSGQFVVSGSLPSEEVVAGIAQVSDLIYSPFLTNDVTVDMSVAPASWLPGAPRAIAVLPIIGEGRLVLDGQSATLTGIAASPEKAALVRGALAAALGENVQIHTELDITGEKPPLYDASAPGDGTVVLQGVMPNEEVAARIVGGAVQAYGADNVVNELTIGENIEATFSMHRVPLTFSQLAPIKQWTVHIENDAISGNLRGGATFATGSAELTPELRVLLDTAAGIIIRNPTVVATIEGHTDSRGSEASNQVLSVARADSAEDYLVAIGVDPNRLTAVGYGESRPIADNETAEGRAENRRIEFVLGPLVAQGDG